MNNRSFQLIRTNPRLTTNIKFVVSSDYNLYLESFDVGELSKNEYKHRLLKTDSMINKDVPDFYKNISKVLAYTPYSSNDVSVMYNKYEFQFDEIYFSGADEIEDKWYGEEFEYFAPLFVVKNSLPSNFIIMRVNDPVIYKKTGYDYSIDNLRNDNFKEEIIDKWKCVSVFDLSDNTNLGKFLKRNINDNSLFPEYSFFFDIKKGNNLKFSGFQYGGGTHTTSEVFLNDIEFQKTHYDLENYITKGFQENGLVYPFIFNFKFLFNDIPATPDKYLKYSMNRYYGFYTDSLELVKTITTYSLPELKTGLIIKNNTFLDSSGAYVNPFKTLITNSDWVQYEDDLYQVNKQSNNSYKIISKKDFTGYDVSLFNTGGSSIKDNFIITSNTLGNIDEYINPDGDSEIMYADLYLIEIDGLYHVLKNNYTKEVVNNQTIFTNNYYIYTDYNISSTKDVLEYYKGGKKIEYNDKENYYNYSRNTLSSLDILSNVNIINYYKRDEGIYNIKNIIQSGKPLLYKIYRVNFSDIKDFDYDRLNTGYSNFDYEKSNYVDTLEKKLNMVEYRDKNSPKRIKLNRFNEDGQYKTTNISSEYITDGDLFEIKNNNTLNTMWDKTQTINKWGYKDSISHSDYPYKINNSFDVGGIYNRTVNTDLMTSNITEKNLDYFYRIGSFYGKDNTPTVNSIGDLSSWTVTDNFTNQFVIDNGEIVVSLDNTHNSITATLNNVVLDVNQEYYVSYNIDLSQGSIINGTTFKVGFSEDFFDDKYIYYNIENIITVSFIAKTKSDKLKFIFENYSKVIINNLYVHKITNKYYLNQSTNVQTDLLNRYDIYNNDNRFNLGYYVDSNFDYFSYFFDNVMYSEDYGKKNIKPYKKYSTFNGGTNSLPAKTLFNGIEYELYDVTDMILNDSVGNKQTISTIINGGGKKYNGYKMSVILSENYNYYKFKYDRVDVNNTYENWIKHEPVIGSDDPYTNFFIGITKGDEIDGNILNIIWDVNEKTYTFDPNNNVTSTLPTNINNNDGTITVNLININPE